MLATLKFDTEDIYYPPEYRIDDIPGWLAEIMTDVGVVGTFCTMGEKARTMKDRGRDDVLTAMARHDLVSHLQGNIHPLLPEILADKEWDDGVAAARAFEDVVCEDFRHAFGSEPVALSRHNMYWGAQHTAVGGERGMCHMSNLLGVPGTEQPCWYAGTLTLPNTVTPGFGGFDTIYSCDDAFNKRFAEIGPFVEACAERGVEYVSLFGCHPVQAVRSMAEIALSAQHATPPRLESRPVLRDSAEAVIRSAAHLAQQLGAAALVVPTTTGGSARAARPIPCPEHFQAASPRLP